MRVNQIVALALVGVLTACGTRSSSSVSSTVSTPGGTVAAEVVPTQGNNVDPAKIAISETDVTDRKYRSLGDISVTVSKNTLFDPDPTREKVNEALQERAAKLGADAVILVRYGTVGIGFASWGVLDGNGRAIAYEK